MLADPGGTPLGHDLSREEPCAFGRKRRGGWHGQGALAHQVGQGGAQLGAGPLPAGQASVRGGETRPVAEPGQGLGQGGETVPRDEVLVQDAGACLRDGQPVISELDGPGGEPALFVRGQKRSEGLKSRKPTLGCFPQPACHLGHVLLAVTVGCRFVCRRLGDRPLFPGAAAISSKTQEAAAGLVRARVCMNASASSSGAAATAKAMAYRQRGKERGAAADASGV